MFTKFTLVAVILSYPGSAIAACDSDENCSRCLISAFGSCQLTYEAVRPIVDAYRSSLAHQATGRWQSLPSEFSDQIRGKFPSIDLDHVRYATNIFTVHGQAITIGYQIYFPHEIDLREPDGKRLMYHELQHVVQYEDRGGVEPFLVEYIAKAIGKIVQKRSFNVHDDIDLEAEANKKADSVHSGGSASNL
ncbi:MULTISPECIES: eCIS core domain-containing protein [Sinorhizobium]|uniref:eCIS core domain-containing protein n=1 Tax=Sinorhizobium americanum TaxID=194963 RepID=A0A2S3YTQ3_9HYPH|nr:MULTISPECIES: DUF4157 domain-containing protein [Sinorhizobium]PDT38069.1 DUF4157 domain-containing protein [Sinorhizobium sp. FG01]POH35016.1 hypothetical protein ATY31_04470 [Sinorhizobium americanum]